MFAIYLFSLLVGGGLLVYALLGTDAHDDLAHADGHNPVEWLSIRTLMYFLFVFGGIGAVLSRTWSAVAAPLVLAVALAGGLGVAATVAATFRFLCQSASGDRESDESFVGLRGTMTLPFGTGGTGKVLVTRGERTFELLAQPFEAGGEPGRWRAVVVVEMRRGIAMVAPSDHPQVRELSLLNP